MTQTIINRWDQMLHGTKSWSSIINFLPSLTDMSVYVFGSTRLNHTWWRPIKIIQIKTYLISSILADKICPKWLRCTEGQFGNLGSGKGGPYLTNLVWIRSQPGVVIMHPVKCGMKLFNHFQNFIPYLYLMGLLGITADISIMLLHVSCYSFRHSWLIWIWWREPILNSY